MTQSKYLEMMAEAKRLMQEAEALRRQEVAEIAKEIAEQLNLHEITLADLHAAGYRFANSQGAAPALKEAKFKRSVEVKYQDPANPDNKWTGRGRTPKWMVNYIKSGSEKENFLIRQDST